MKLAEHHRQITDELARHGIKPAIEPTHSNHVRLRWRANDHQQSMTVAKHAGDWRATRNNLAKVRRLLREAGVEAVGSPPTVPKAAPPPPSTDDEIARLKERVAFLERDAHTRMAQLENDVRILLDRTAPPSPAPPPEPAAPKSKRQGQGGGRKRGDLSWLWREMRYDEFRTYADIAKATGKRAGYISVILSQLKKLGLVENRSGEGWRKHSSLESPAAQAKLSSRGSNANGMAAHH